MAGIEWEYELLIFDFHLEASIFSLKINVIYLETNPTIDIMVDFSIKIHASKKAFSKEFASNRDESSVISFLL